jgi:GGDEF domain-containing protein
MTEASDRDLLAEFSNAVAAYLNSMSAIADCLEQTHPEVGGPYRQRIQRLRSRVAFDASREAIKKSASTLESELKDYAGVAHRVVTERGVESKRGVLALGDIIESLAERQTLFGNHLLHLAAQIENVAWPQDGPAFSEIKARHASALRGLVENMGREAASKLRELRDQMTELDQRMAGVGTTDPVTGLVNRRELDRQIEAHKLHGSTYAVLLFELHGPISEQVLRMATARLVTKFRHTDWIGRWSETEFAVLFLGDPEIAQTRAVQTVAALQGRYTLENGESVLIEAKGRMLQSELALA